MTIRFFLGMISFCVAMYGAVFSSMLTYAMLAELNQMRPKNKRISYFKFMTSINLFDYWQEYRDKYPEGKLTGQRRIAAAFLYGGLAFMAVCMMLRFK